MATISGRVTTDSARKASQQLAIYPLVTGVPAEELGGLTLPRPARSAPGWLATPSGSAAGDHEAANPASGAHQLSHRLSTPKLALPSPSVVTVTPIAPPV